MYQKQQQLKKKLRNQKNQIMPGANQEMNIESLSEIQQEERQASTRFTEDYVSMDTHISVKFIEDPNIKVEEKPKIQFDLNDKQQELVRIYHDQSKIMRMKESFNFYQTFVGSVEIWRNEQLYKVFYDIPLEAKFITENIRYDMIYNQNKNSDQERIEQFVNQISKYRGEMIFQQRIDIYLALRIFVKNWRIIKDLSYYLVVIISMYQVLFYIYDETSEQKFKTDVDQDIDYVFGQGLTSLQLLLALIAFWGCLIERYPVSLYSLKFNAAMIQKVQLQKENGLQSSQNIIDQYYYYQMQILQKLFDLFDRRPEFEIVKIMLDFENLYNLGYLIITIFTIQYPLALCILLLDIIKQSDDLKNIMKSITMNFSMIISTMSLTIMIIYVFTCWGFLTIDQYFQPNLDKYIYGQNLWMFFISLVHYGLTWGGGIGDAIQGEGLEGPYNQFWPIYAFTIVWFIVINIMCINMTMGIIIDSFGQLREEQLDLLDIIKSKCFICAVSKEIFASQGSSWESHYKQEHNIYDYLQYIMKIQVLRVDRSDGMQQYIKQQLRDKLVEFIPFNTAICIKDVNIEEEE